MFAIFINIAAKAETKEATTDIVSAIAGFELAPLELILLF
jgi:hypothetical protein